LTGECESQALQQICGIALAEFDPRDLALAVLNQGLLLLDWWTRLQSKASVRSPQSENKPKGNRGEHKSVVTLCADFIYTVTEGVGIQQKMVLPALPQR